VGQAVSGLVRKYMRGTAGLSKNPIFYAKIPSEYYKITKFLKKRNEKLNLLVILEFLVGGGTKFRLQV
jgi:hypothetical protein